MNLPPIAGLERHLHRLQGARLALRAVREAVLEPNGCLEQATVRGLPVIVFHPLTSSTTAEQNGTPR